MTLRWGILGTGNIAKTFAAGLKAAKHGALVAVGSRSLATALAFGKDHGDLPASKCYGSYDEVLQDPDVDIVYICSPHPQHYAMALQAAQAKKHMLVEKPIAMTLRQVETIVNVCKDNNVFLMEAYMYRCHPQTKALAEHVKNGAIGQVKLIRASFAYDGTQFDHTSRLWRHELGGGAVMDIGGYPMSLARLIVGAARGQPFVNPTQIKAVGHVQPSTKVDEWSIASLHFDEADGQHAISAQLFAGIFADSDCSVEVIGTEGSLRVANLWRPDLTFLGSVQLEWKKKGDTHASIVPLPLEETNLYAYEIDAVAQAIEQQHRLECSDMSLDDTLGQAVAMDLWRQEIGLVYQEDSA